MVSNFFANMMLIHFKKTSANLKRVKLVQFKKNEFSLGVGHFIYGRYSWQVFVGAFASFSNPINALPWRLIGTFIR